jgi:outer membrane protein assembly factor BamB
MIAFAACADSSSTPPMPTPTPTPVPQFLPVQDDGTVYGLDLSARNIGWNQPAAPADPAEQPVVSNGTAYFVTHAGSFGNDGYIYAWNVFTGERVWAHQVHDDLYGPAVDNGVAYAGGNQDGVYAWRVSDAHELWHVKPGTRLDSKSAPAAADGLVYIGEGDNSLYALNATDGSVKWSAPLGDFVDASPTVANGVVYVGLVNCDDAGLASVCDYAFGADTGKLLWRTVVAHRLCPGGCESIAGGRLLVQGGVVYGTVHRFVYALNASDGTPLWQYDPWQDMGQPGGTPDILVDGSSLYLMARFESLVRIQTLNLSDHAVRWSLQDAIDPQAVSGSTSGLVGYDLLAVAHETVFVAKTFSITNGHGGRHLIHQIEAIAAADPSSIWTVTA